MDVNIILLNANPFFEAYSQSDLLGKFIFLFLYAISFVSWAILLQKIWITYQARKEAFRFQQAFRLQKFNPLNLDCESLTKQGPISPFLDLYRVLKKQSLEVLAKNRHFNKLQNPEEPVTSTHQSLIPSHSLSLNDIDFVASHLSSQVAQEVKHLERHLYLLATAVSLAPFLGLLGTVWGILTTFSEMQTQSSGSAHQMVLSGLSLALATTVLGLLDAIPALLGYNYLKNSIRDLTTEMESFSNEILAAVELQYRKVDS